MKITYKLLIIFLVPLLMLSALVLQTDAQESAVDVGSGTSTSVVIAVDATSTMAGERITAVNVAVQSFFARTGNSVPVALLSYNTEAALLVDYTTSVTDVLNGLDNIQYDNSTALYDGLQEAVRVAAASSADNRIVIFLTDGTNSGSTIDQRTPIALAQAEGIVINTIALGPDASRSFLSEAAAETGGQFFPATSFGLSSVYETIGADLEIDTTTVVASDQSSVVGPGVSVVPQDITVLTGSGSEGATTGSGAVEITDSVTDSSLDTSIAPLDTAITTDGEVVSIVFAFDNTGSVTPNILLDFQNAIGAFDTAVDRNVRMALIAFNEETQVLSNFTTDVGMLQASLEDLNPAGRSSLLDATITAALIASEAEAANPIVLLLTDGADSTSSATEETVLQIASETGVRFDTIALGSDADTAYLRNLSQETGGEFYATNSSSDLPNIYETIGEQVARIIQQAEPSVIDSVASGQVPNVTSPFTLDIPTQQDSTFNDVPDIIPPINNDLMELGLGDVASAPTTSAPLTDTATTDTEDDGIIDPSEVVADVVQPDLVAFFPVEIMLEDEEFNVELAELSLNQVTLAVYDRAPFEYPLRSDLLRRGSYLLTFSVINDRDVVSRDTLEFIVELDEVGDPMILVDGEESSLILNFSTNEGLTVAPDPTSEVDQAQAQTLGDILLRPFDSIPQPVRDAFTQQRPGLVAFVIVIMTVILMPQGLFTIYWMTYTWVNPERMESSRAPEQYYDPEISFTALLPARREEQVIHETIRTVDNIDYPEHLKEILVLIRDDDDDETIAETMRAIDDIKQSYIGRGEEYPDNVHLITFTDGPKNKPNGLNRGYKVSTKDVLCIFDAEDAPHPEIYNTINTVMIRDEADVVQAGVQLMNFDYNWFSAFNVLEYFFWFKSGLHAFTHGTKVTPLGGNTVFFRKEWLDKLAAEDTEKGYRAWDEGTLTEDADVGIRLTTLGAKIQIVYEAELATQEETPHNVEQFIKQRTRWCQGFYEIFKKGDWLQLPSMTQRVAAVYILLNSLLQAAILIFLPIGLFIALTQQVSVIVSLVSYLPIFLMVTQAVIILVGMREFTDAYGLRLPLGFRLRMIFFYYPYQLLLSISAMRAIFRFLTNQSTWEKTAHSNLHRQNAKTVASAN